MKKEENVYRMQLSKKIEIDGEMSNVLVIPEPTAGALMECDLTFNAKGMTLNVGQLLGVIAAAAQVPPSTVQKIPMRDIASNMQGLLFFLGIDTHPTG